ncbi:SEC-C metal-binding domain-containing protein [Streptomyces sp. QTS52]
MSSKRRTSGRSSKNKSARTNGRALAPRPGASPPTRDDHTRFAQESEELAERYPEDREQLLMEAADAWSDAGEYDRAVALYERFLDPEGEGCAEPDLVDAFRIGTLWDAGREEEARAAVTAFRKRHPRDAGAWNFVAEAFEERGETATAAECYTAGVTHALGTGAPVTVDTVEADPHHFDVGTLFIGRHRVRRLLDEPHDDWDDVADALHERRASPLLGRVNTLDERHDPVRLRRLKEEGSVMLEDELRGLLDSLPADDRPTRATLRSVCVLYWPPEEFAQLLTRWPKAADAYGDDQAGHRRQVERTLRELSDEGAPSLAVGHATLTGLTAYAAGDGGSPDSPATRSAYGAELARRGEAADWPPPRNGPCWCGSERKYKKCCGNPALD